MENHKIIYNERIELPLISAPYPMVKDKEREQVVLQMYADAELVTATDVELLATNVRDITYYIQTVTVDGEGNQSVGEWQPKATYPGYTCGAAGLVYGYANGRYNIQLLRQDKIATKVDNLRSTMESQANQIVAAEQMVTELDLQSIATEQAITDMDLRLLEVGA